MGSILIHNLFRTTDVDPNKVNNSSYLDLGPLCGHNNEQQSLVRTFKDGLLKPYIFSEIRVLGFPPDYCLLFFLFLYCSLLLLLSTFFLFILSYPGAISTEFRTHLRPNAC
ncbi:hypothetical protein V1517DRAFT_75686 [Lipomyces orientalis]|uniref:Uncharacterized protein n=1 Tax=Lipomyces orientalis TaxID=1233043 RepID=A0ACC3TDN1_9ASCO